MICKLALLLTPWGSVAVIVTEVVVDTVEVVTVKVPVVAPAPIVTLPGTDAEALLLFSVILTPVVEAAPLRVTVPVGLDPPLTVVGARLTDKRSGGLMTRVVLIDDEPMLAVILGVVFVLTLDVVTPNVAVDAPELTATLFGTEAEALLLASDTSIPPVGAGPLSEIEPVAALPPIRVLGSNASDLSNGEVMVNVVWAELDPTLPVIFDVVVLATAVVVSENVAVVAPAMTVTELGTTADAFDELSVTETPFVPAFADNVTVPLECVPPTTEAGVSDSFVKVCP